MQAAVLVRSLQHAACSTEMPALVSTGAFMSTGCSLQFSGDMRCKPIECWLSRYGHTVRDGSM